MSAQIRFSISGFLTPVEAEAIKHGLKEALRQVEQGQELQKAYNLPDVPTASLITLAFRNSLKAYLEAFKEKDGPEEGNSSQEGQSVRGPEGDGN